MDPQFEELAERITRDVTTAVTRDVTATVTRDVTTTLTAAVTANLNAHVTQVVAGAERRLTDHVTNQLKAAEQRLSSQATINAEAVRSEARMAAEAYGGVLDSINRRLDSIDEKVTANHRETVAILGDHNERIPNRRGRRRPG
jgi:hypothetical protein